MDLRIARKIARLSRQELARRADVDLAALIAIESDPGAIYDQPYRSVIHLAQALGVSPGDLFPVPALLPKLPRLIDPPPATDPREDDDHA